MGIFDSRTSQTIPLVSDPGVTVTVRPLTGKEVEAAQVAQLKTFVNGQPTRGWNAKFQRVLAGVATTEDLSDPLIAFDRMSIVKSGCLGCSLIETWTPDVVDEMSDEALDEIATYILQRTKPHLYAKTADDAKAAQVKDSSLSTST